MKITPEETTKIITWIAVVLFGGTGVLNMSGWRVDKWGLSEDQRVMAEAELRWNEKLHLAKESIRVEIKAEVSKSALEMRSIMDANKEIHDIGWPKPVVRDRVIELEECAATVCKDYKKPSNRWN